MNDHTIVHLDPDDPLSLRTRTETLKKLVLQQTIDNRALAASNYTVTADEIWEHLRRKAADMVEKGGRLIHGDVTISTHDDFLRDCAVFRMEVMTRENHAPPWGEVWQAIREDEEDRRHAKYYWEDEDDAD